MIFFSTYKSTYTKVKLKTMAQGHFSLFFSLQATLVVNNGTLPHTWLHKCGSSSLKCKNCKSQSWVRGRCMSQGSPFTRAITERCINSSAMSTIPHVKYTVKHLRRWTWISRIQRPWATVQWKFVMGSYFLERPSGVYFPRRLNLYGGFRDGPFLHTGFTILSTKGFPVAHPPTL